MKLIKGKNGQEICRNILNLMNEGKGNELIENFQVKINGDFIVFQNILFSISKTKKELEYIVSLSKGLISSLKLIQENIDHLLTLDSYYFPISLGVNINVEDVKNIDAILILVLDINKKGTWKNYKIINIDELFENLSNFSYYKDLKDLGKLHYWIPFINKDKKGEKLIMNFHQKIHEKGMNLIKNKELSTNEIFNFIMSQDAFYFMPIYNKSE